MNVQVFTFGEIGLGLSVPDDELWNVCQRLDIVLLTGNRNKRGARSLEEAIQLRGTLQSLPVLTLADPDRVLKDRLYGERVAVDLMEVLMDLEGLRGSGRIFLPRDE